MQTHIIQKTAQRGMRRHTDEMFRSAAEHTLGGLRDMFEGPRDAYMDDTEPYVPTARDRKQDRIQKILAWIMVAGMAVMMVCGTIPR